MNLSAQAVRAVSMSIVLPDGDPFGIRTVEKSNWTGHALIFPRSLFPSAKKRKEVTRAGVYLLVGDDDRQGLGLPRVYIGEGDPVLPRLEQHYRQKEFWTHAIVYSSKDESLNKAHIQYLESKLVQVASSAKRCELDNGNIPQAPTLGEADLAMATGYLDELLLCMPVIGYQFLNSPLLNLPQSENLFLKGKEAAAEGLVSSEGFVVLKGSKAIKSAAHSILPNLDLIRQTLVDKGIFADTGDHYVLTQDYTFATPSTAAGVLLGRSANGRIEWKDGGGRTLKEIQDASVAMSVLTP